MILKLKQAKLENPNNNTDLQKVVKDIVKNIIEKHINENDDTNMEEYINTNVETNIGEIMDENAEKIIDENIGQIWQKWRKYRRQNISKNIDANMDEKAGENMNTKMDENIEKIINVNIDQIWQAWRKYRRKDEVENRDGDIDVKMDEKLDEKMDENKNEDLGDHMDQILLNIVDHPEGDSEITNPATGDGQNGLNKSFEEAHRPTQKNVKNIIIVLGIVGLIVGGSLAAIVLAPSKKVLDEDIEKNTVGNNAPSEKVPPGENWTGKDIEVRARMKTSIQWDDTLKYKNSQLYQTKSTEAKADIEKLLDYSKNIGSADVTIAGFQARGKDSRRRESRSASSTASVKYKGLVEVLTWEILTVI